MEGKKKPPKLKRPTEVKSLANFEEEFKCFDSDNKLDPGINMLGKQPNGFTIKIKSFKDNNYYILKICQQKDADLTKQMIKDIMDVARIRHPNLQDYYEVYSWEDDGVHTIAVKAEFCGQDINTLIEQKIKNKIKFTDVEVIYLMKYTFEAIKVINKTGNNHLGIKPTNIFINDQSVIKLCDYGYCKLHEKMGVYSTTTQPNEKNIYSSPEYLLAREDPSKQEDFDGYKSDIWSLAMTLFRCCNLEKEEKISSYNNTEQNNQETIQPVIKKILSRYFQNVFNNALQVDHEKRPGMKDFVKIMKRGKLEILKQQVKKSEDD